MEFHLKHKILRGETAKVPVPNLKSLALIPSKIHFISKEQEFTLMAQNNQIIKVGEPYFRVFANIDLTDYRGKIAEGDDLTVVVKNLAKKELLVDFIITYDKHVGNIIYTNSFCTDNLIETCLGDVADAGLLSQLIIDADEEISSIVFDPIYKLGHSTNSEKVEQLGYDLEDFSHWSSALAIQNSNPDKRIVIDFMDPDLKNYVKFLKFYRLKIMFTENNEPVDKKANANRYVHLLAYGYK